MDVCVFALVYRMFRMDSGSFVNPRPPITRPDARISTELAGEWGATRGPRDTFKPHLYLYPSQYYSLPPSRSASYSAREIKGPEYWAQSPQRVLSRPDGAAAACATREAFDDKSDSWLGFISLYLRYPTWPDYNLMASLHIAVLVTFFIFNP